MKNNQRLDQRIDRGDLFAGSLPATRVAVADFDPVFLTCARATLAALLSLTLLMLLRQARPKSVDVPALAVTARCGGRLSALDRARAATRHVGPFDRFRGAAAALCTASFAVLRAGERPRPAFWLFSVVEPPSWSATR